VKHLLMQTSRIDRGLTRYYTQGNISIFAIHFMNSR
jgi:hypothetical protein